MTRREQSTSESDLVKVAYASDESEAELLQGLLRTATDAREARGHIGRWLTPRFVQGGRRRARAPRRRGTCASGSAAPESGGRVRKRSPVRVTSKLPAKSPKFTAFGDARGVGRASRCPMGCPPTQTHQPTAHTKKTCKCRPFQSG
jgi:hypothetical protein